MIPKEKNYVYGTAAPKIEYDVYAENKVLKAKKKQRANNKVKLKAVLTIMVCFAAFFYIMLMYAQITEVNYNLNKLNRKYAEAKNENIRLKLEIESSLDLNTVKEIAETRLSMQKPDKSQIVYVKVPKSDVTKVAMENNSGIKGEGVVSAVSNMFSKVIRLFE